MIPREQKRKRNFLLFYQGGLGHTNKIMSVHEASDETFL